MQKLKEYNGLCKELFKSQLSGENRVQLVKHSNFYQGKAKKTDLKIKYMQKKIYGLQLKIMSMHLRITCLKSHIPVESATGVVPQTLLTISDLKTVMEGSFVNIFMKEQYKRLKR